VSAKETCVCENLLLLGRKLGMALGGVKVWILTGVCFCTL
jgi:hypothetical protein